MAVWDARLATLALELVRDRLVADLLRPGTEGPVGGRPLSRCTIYQLGASTPRIDPHSLTKDTPHASAVYLLTY